MIPMDKKKLARGELGGCKLFRLEIAGVPIETSILQQVEVPFYRHDSF